jgi:hypothetical protein
VRERQTRREAGTQNHGPSSEVAGLPNSDGARMGAQLHHLCLYLLCGKALGGQR